MDLSLSSFENQLAKLRPAAISDRRLKRSAVAVVLRYERAAPDILLMKRAERKGDRWSGQVSLPGGRESASDADLRTTAIRETREEVGLDLDHVARPIGRLDTIRARAKGGVQPLTITPYVFVQTKTAPLVLNHEAESAFWLPFDRVAAGELSDRFNYRIGPLSKKLPCWRHEGYVVWGLTYKILEQLLGVISPR